MLSSKPQITVTLALLLLAISNTCRGAAASPSPSLRSWGEQVDNTNLVAVAQIHRHGQRIPVTFVANDPYADSSYWPFNKGELTNTGKRQHYSLGKLTRSRYSDFLPSTYNNSLFYAQTTDMDRTHMSAQANMAGIFEPHDAEIWKEDMKWQPIPLRVMDENILQSIPDCSLYTAEVANVLINAAEYAMINKREAELYEFLTNNTGNNVTSLSGVSTVYDTMIIEDQFGFKLPQWTEKVYPKPIVQLSGWYFAAYSYTDYQKKLAAGSWLNYILEYFVSMFEDPTSSQKYRLFSAHDYNIAAILNTMGAYDFEQPPAFASTIYFELRNKSGNPILNVWYKNDDQLEQVNVRGCDFDCPLDDFASLLQPWLVNTTTWDELCNKSSSDLTDLSTVHSLDEVMRELEAVVQHANDRRNPQQPLANTALKK